MLDDDVVPGPLSLERPPSASEDLGNLAGVFRIRLAKSRSDNQDIGELVRRRYSERGYDVPQGQLEKNLVSFVAYNQGTAVGTMSMRFDSPEGLRADDLYSLELNTLRQQGSKLCEFTRLAVDTNRKTSAVLAGLFHTAYLLAYRVFDYDRVIIEVNPSHVALYKQGLGFEILGPERANDKIGAPSVLLSAPFSWVEDALRSHAGTRGSEASAKVRSLYAFGFPPEEESGVLERLRRIYGPNCPETSNN